MLKLFKPRMSWRAGFYTLRTLYSGQIGEGPRVIQFENEFARVFNKEKVIAVNSGTSALELAYELADIKEKDEVITPILTCTATNLPLARRKAKIIFADITRDLNVDTHDIERKITKRTKAIVFVHFGGNNRGLREVLDLGKKFNIKVIEDAAQAIGSDYWGQSDFTAISLQAIKTLTSGDGGILLCKKKTDYDTARRLRWFGYDREKKHRLGDTDLTEVGYKYHMNDISASIGLGNLRSIKRVLAHKQHLIAIYNEYGLFTHSWLAGGLTSDYRGLKRTLQGHGIEMGQHHYRNDKYTIFGSRQKLPMMDELENKYFFIPSHYRVSLLDAHRIGKLCEPYLETK